MINTRNVNSFEEKLKMAANLDIPEPTQAQMSRMEDVVVNSVKNQASAMPKGRWYHRPAYALTLILAILAIIITLVVGPQRVFAAMKNLFGYLPGIGVVQDEGEILLLAEPVTMERDGTTVTIEQAATDHHTTVIVFEVEGLPPVPEEFAGEDVPTGSLVTLQLPDGTLLSPSGGEGGGWYSGYWSRKTFAGLPEGVDQATLLIPRLQFMPEGVAPENWKVDLAFEPAPEDMDLLPVYEINIPTASEGTLAPDGLNQETVSELDGIRLSLDNVIELENGYLIEGQISWDDLADVLWVDTLNFEMSDGDGQKIPVEQASPLTTADVESENTQGVRWAIRTNQKNIPGPWTIIVPSVNVTESVNTEFPFTFPSEPAPGQNWDLDMDFRFAEFSAKLTSLRVYQPPDDLIWLEFSFATSPEVFQITVRDLDPSYQSSYPAGRGGTEGLGVVQSSFTYDTPPTGLHHFQIAGIAYRKSGPWQVTWQPPMEEAETDVVEPVSAASTVCLTDENWQSLMNESQAPLPDDLEGQLILQTHVGQMLPMISVVPLDGSPQKKLSTGAWSSLSPDGKTVAYSQGEGIFLSDISTGERTQLVSGEYPVWSPDGEWIAFLQISEKTVYRIRRDGSELEKIFSDPNIIRLAGWTLDGKSMVYSGFVSGGEIAIQAFSMEAGDIELWQALETRKPTSRPVLSPDGGRIAFPDRQFGQVYSVYIAPPGQSEPVLIASLGNANIYVGEWSPDGKWLAVSIYETGVDNPVSVLIQPDTCRLIPLQSLSGEVTGWGEMLSP